MSFYLPSMPSMVSGTQQMLHKCLSSEEVNEEVTHIHFWNKRLGIYENYFHGLRDFFAHFLFHYWKIQATLKMTEKLGCY